MKKTTNPFLLFCFLCLITTLVSCKRSDKDTNPILPQKKDINLTLGNPSNAVQDINIATNYLLQKAEYTLSYNTSKGTANWVSWKLTSSSLGNTPRQEDYRSDNSLPSQWYHVSETDYSGSGFDRGHLCPSGDRTNNVTSNSTTFLMTNMIPQAPNNNQLTWQDLENYCRALINSGSELYIIAGPNGSGGSGNNGGTTYSLASGKIIVPQYVWKIVVILPKGASEASNVTSSTRVIAVKMPNAQSVSAHPWGYYRTSIDQLEILTGYDFLSEVPVEIQNAIESRTDNGPTN